MRIFPNLFAAKDFRRYFIGNFVSLVGTWMQRVAISWLAWELTGSSFWVGLIAFAELIPVVLFSLFGGALADRYSRLRLVLLSQVLLAAHSAFLLAAFSFDLLSPVFLVLFNLFNGIFFVLGQAARLSMVYDIVPRSHIIGAIALNTSAVNISKFAGPLGGAAVLAISGIGEVIFLNILSYIVMISLIWKISESRELPKRTGRASIFADAAASVSIFAHRVDWRLLLLILLVGSLFFRGMIELMPVVVADWMGREAALNRSGFVGDL